MVINERDILGTQLIKRNDELATLYEKIKIQQSTLTKGEVQYQERVVDIVHLRETILNLKRELVIAKRQIENLPQLKGEAYQLQREIMQAKTKVEALKEEAKNPMNVHRYRKLEGTSPETYEMINKIQTLQRRLIAKTEEVEEKDFLIKEKEKLYVELKNILARQPGPEVAEHLTAYQDTLKDKTKQMKTMVKELKIYQAQVNEYKFEIERLTGQIEDLKHKWFDEQIRKKREEQPEQSPNIMT
jgi:chromosome segregation ATPase